MFNRVIWKFNELLNNTFYLPQTAINFLMLRSSPQGVMAKKRSRRPAPAPTTPVEVDESNAVVREEDMMRDEIDEHLLSRDEIRLCVRSV